MRTRQTGFTLVELILVMVVMGLLAGVALPRLTDHRSQDEMRTRDQLKATLRLARQVAVAQNRPVCFVRTAAQFNLVYATGGGVCSLGGTVLTEPGTGAQALTELPAGVALSGANTLQFDARGRLVPYLAGQSITVGTTAPLLINHETGFVY